MFVLHNLAVQSDVLDVGLAVRMPLSYFVMYGAGLNWRERLFIAFAWSPKVHMYTVVLCCPAQV